MQYRCLQVRNLFSFQFRKDDEINNVCEAGHNGEFHLLYLETIQHIKIINDLCTSDQILVYEELGINTLQKDSFS